jgi:hypothetical protein
MTPLDPDKRAALRAASGLPPDDDRQPDDTLVRLPLLPSPAEMQLLRAERAHIEEQLRSRAVTAVDVVAETAQALGQMSNRLDDAVLAARAAGASWAQIARAVGISRQAATQRWSPAPEQADQ